MSLSLRAKILVIATVVILCVIATVSATSAYLSAREYETALESRSSAIAKSLKIQLDRLLQLGLHIDDIIGFEEQCQEIVDTYPGIDFAMVVGRDGNVLFHSDDALSSDRVRGPLLEAVQDRTEAVVTSTTDGVTWHNAAIPAISPAGEHVATVFVGFRADRISSKVEQMLWSTLGASLLVLLLGLFILHAGLAAFVTRPLGSLIATLVNLRDTPLNLGRRASVDSDDELGQLGRAFNDLMDELQTTTVSKSELEQALEELKRVSDALFEQKEEAEVTLHSIGDAVITLDGEQRVQYLNPAAETLTGWQRDDALGRPLDEVVTLSEERSRDAPWTAPGPVSAFDQAASAANVNLELDRADGNRISVQHTLAPMHDSEGHRTGCVLTLRDVSAERRLAQRLSWEASHDMLTGLANRREFTDRVDVAVASAQREGDHHVVCFMDLDRFKVVNDTCGHAAGDRLLKELADVLRSRTRQSDTMARLGGDEFALLLTACSMERARLIANDLLAAVGDYRFDHEGKMHTVGVSIGLASATGDASTAEVLSMADTACYWAKERGRNRVCVYQIGDHDMAARRQDMNWASRIMSALEEDRFTLYYQTYLALDADGESPNHLEVLLRLVDEEGQLVHPHSFIPAAERYNLMPEVDRWVIRTVFSHYHALVSDRGGAPLTCAINLSGTSLNTDGLLDFIREQAERHELPPNAICFEITETAAINNLRSAGEFIQACKTMGMLFALDDFGTGTSSFGYLKNLSVDYLKIDGGFVKNMASDEVDRAMTDTINRIGHIMGIKTVAEFAESEAIIRELRELGVDYAQGYGISIPSPLLPLRSVHSTSAEDRSHPAE